MEQLSAIRRVAVIGSGVMGAQLAALFSGYGFQVDLFDLASTTAAPKDFIKNNLRKLKKINPTPLFSLSSLERIQPRTLEHDLQYLAEADLIIEAIAEKLEIKADLYSKISQYINTKAIIASNTSGLSIQVLSQAIAEDLRPRFLGLHFFNPPKYVPLVELIVQSDTNPEIAKEMEVFLVKCLGRVVIHVKDTANFLANRLGIFAMLATDYHAQRLGLPFDIVDALTGQIMGRPKSATYRTIDLVGLDVFAAVIENMQSNLPDDPWNHLFNVPSWLKSLLQMGALGAKNKVGIYKKEKGEILVWDQLGGLYRPCNTELSESVQRFVHERDPRKKIKLLTTSKDNQLRLICAIYRDLLHYIAFHAESLTQSPAVIDQALKYGFSWAEGPLELWQRLGWKDLRNWLTADIKKKKTLGLQPLPKWVNTLAEGIYQEDKSYNFESAEFEVLHDSAVYKNHLYPHCNAFHIPESEYTLFENNAGRLWHAGDDIAILSLKNKMHIINKEVFAAIEEALQQVPGKFKGLIYWSYDQPHFSAGADLKYFLEILQQGGPELFKSALKQFQEYVIANRKCSFPTVAVVQGFSLGGGCEWMLHCDRVVAAPNSYIGLVELGVGLIPAGGGSKEMAYRASISNDPEKSFSQYFQTIAQAKVSRSAYEAKLWGYLREDDVIVANPKALLKAAKAQIETLDAAGQNSQQFSAFKTLPESSYAQALMAIKNMKLGGYISEYDAYLAERLAYVMTGGECADEYVLENWLLQLERDVFVDLLMQAKTQDRIKYMLKTRKPLRN
jgi:3-hydroxyacyl-CoA dehydrogenase